MGEGQVFQDGLPVFLGGVINSLTLTSTTSALIITQETTSTFSIGTGNWAIFSGSNGALQIQTSNGTTNANQSKIFFQDSAGASYLNLLLNPSPVGGAGVYRIVQTPARTIAFTTSNQTADVAVWEIAAATFTQVSSQNVTNAAALRIDAAPIASTNMTFTNTYAIQLVSGAIKTAGIDYNITAKSSGSPYTVLGDDDIISVTTGASAYTVTLPASTGNGRRVVVIKADSGVGAVTVARAGADTIEGATSVSLATQFKKCHLIDYASGLWMDLAANLI